MLNDQRADDLRQFYELLTGLEHKLGGARRLSECSGRMGWPQRGVYFFREPGELRRNSGQGQRIVRVGANALKRGSRSTLWQRLSQHRGNTNSSGGNHRGSIFRLIVGASTIERDGYSYSSWGKGNAAPKEVRERERPLEQAVSAVLGRMSCLWIDVEDEPGPDSLRGYIERNAIALLSNYGRTPLDPPSSGWLGRFSNRGRVRRSGLWNSNHVDETYAPDFLDTLTRLIDRMR